MSLRNLSLAIIYILGVLYAIGMLSLLHRAHSTTNTQVRDYTTHMLQAFSARRSQDGSS